MRDTLVFIVLTVLLPTNVYATEFNHRTLKTIIEHFSALDKTCNQMVKSSAAEEKEYINKFRSELYMAVAVLNGINTSSNEKFAEPIRDYSKVLSEVMNGVSQKKSTADGKKLFTRAPGNLMALPMITMGIAMAVMTPEGVSLSDSEREDILDIVESTYENEQLNSSNIRSKNPFAVSVLTIADMLRSVK